MLKKTLRISHKWANKRINCTPQGILEGCMGYCCKAPFYPGKANRGLCVHLTLFGCALPLSQRPIKCLLYPFVMKNEMLVLYGRALMHSCKKCYQPTNQQVMTIYENLRPTFVELFGESEYERVREDVVEKKRDSFFVVSPWFEKQVRLEEELEKRNENPIPRKQ